MALINNQYCKHCEEEKPHLNGECRDCSERIYREEMAAWKAKTTDEKLLDIHKRLLRLEQGPVRY